MATHKSKKIQPSPEEATKYLIKQELKDSQEWQRLKKEFSGEELKLFEEKYLSFVAQVRGNILASETTQLIQSIKFEVLMSRYLIARNEAIKEEEEIRKQIQQIKDRADNQVSKLPPEERQELMVLLEQIKDLKANAKENENFFIKLSQEHKNLYDKLKMSRDQRVRLEDSTTETFLGLIKKLQRADIQAKEARENELVKIATEKEYRRLGSYHRFEDGVLDKPILSSDTIDQPQAEGLELE